MRRKATGLKVSMSRWFEVLQTVNNTSCVLFYQESSPSGAMPASNSARKPARKNVSQSTREPARSAERFLNKSSAWHSPQLCDASSSETFSVASIEQKSGVLEAVLRLLGRYSQLERKRDGVTTVTDELLLNALISAPRAAAELGLEAKAGANCSLVMEWTSEELWIHMLDPWGAFRRNNFARAFRPYEHVVPTHGHSGRGMQIILQACTDLYIMSQPSEITWVAVRFDLTLSNAQQDNEPKYLLLDIT